MSKSLAYFKTIDGCLTLIILLWGGLIQRWNEYRAPNARRVWKKIYVNVNCFPYSHNIQRTGSEYSTN